MALRQPLQTLSISPSGKLLAVACGPKVQVVDVENNAIIASSNDSNSHGAKTMVRHLVWYTDSQLVSSGEDKIVKEWRLTTSVEGGSVSLELQQQIELPKRANAISVTADGQSLVVADKFGDVYAFPMAGCTPSLPSPPAPKFAPEASTSIQQLKEDTPEQSEPLRPGEITVKNGKRKKVGDTGGVAPAWRHVPAKISTLTPVVGHVSMLTAMLVLQDQGMIITADRDEQIRVSKWPQGWEIEHFLLGQKKFVSAMVLLPSDPNILITGGGDDHLRVWDLTTYKCIRKDISVQAFMGTAEIKIEIAPTQPGRRTQKRIKDKVAKAQAKKDAAPEGKDETEPSTPAPEQDQQMQEGEEADATTSKFKPKLKKLDIGIIQMVFVGSQESSPDPLLVIQSVGSSALLAWPASSLLDTSRELSPQVVDFGSPVLGISGDASSKSLWVSLDVSNTPEKPAVQALQVQDQKLVMVEHPAAKILLEECADPVTAEKPYPGVQALFPDTALLSKDPQGTFGLPTGAPGLGEEGADEEGGDLAAEE